MMATSTTAQCAPAQQPPTPGLLCQRFPRSGPLSGNLNLDRDALVHQIGGLRGTVYCYILTTVKDAGGEFAQVGCAPNFQGGLVTLCTCKGQMRAGRDIEAWEVGDIWIAGVAGAEAGPLGTGHLFYLMRVEHAFASHRDLWAWLSAHAPKAAQAKAADRHPLGDVYRPRDPSGDPYDPRAYALPCRDHPHADNEAWHEDVNYPSTYGRRPALLVGDPHCSYLWSRPRVSVPFHVSRGCKIVDLATLLA
ncbi:MAG TPA: hypothetical protein VGR57_16840 [Ktedonobacterales bacterium]|nr:hypothetical protein [Ktedonobacterales bacterium]